MNISKKYIIGISLCFLIMASLLFSLIKSGQTVITTHQNDSDASSSTTVEISQIYEPKSSQVGDTASILTFSNIYSSQSSVIESKNEVIENKPVKINDKVINTLKKFSRDNSVTLSLLTYESDFALPISLTVDINEKITKVMQDIETVTSSLDLFPLKNATEHNNKIEIIIIGGLKGGQATSEYRYVDAINYIYINLNGFDINQARTHFLKAMSKSMINAAKTGEFSLKIGVFNPGDFVYGNVMPQYVFNGKYSSDTCFFSVDGQMDCFQDLEDFFIEYMTNNNHCKNVDPTFLIYYKLTYIKDSIKQYFS